MSLVQQHGNPSTAGQNKGKQIQKEEGGRSHPIRPPSARRAAKCNINAPTSQAAVEKIAATDN
jgi:hypothetical protein